MSTPLPLHVSRELHSSIRDLPVQYTSPHPSIPNPSTDRRVQSLCLRWVSTILESIAMAALYPLQSRCISFLKSVWRLRSDGQELAITLEALMGKGYHVHRVILSQGGFLLEAFTISRKPDTQKWILQVLGRSASIAESAEAIAETYLGNEIGLLLINGPGIGQSEGTARFGSMASAQRVGIEFLEDVIKATHIALVGHSFGTAILSLACSEHQFRDSIHYTIIYQMGFADLGSMTAAFTRMRWTQWLIHHLNLRLSVKENVHKHLTQKRIKCFVLQATKTATSHKLELEDFESDGVIPQREALGYALMQSSTEVYHVGLGQCHHAELPVWETTRDLIVSAWRES